MDEAFKKLKDNAQRESEIADRLEQIKQQRDALNKKAEQLQQGWNDLLAQREQIGATGNDDSARAKSQLDKMLARSKELKEDQKLMVQNQEKLNELRKLETEGRSNPIKTTPKRVQKAFSLFDMLDSNQDGKIGIFEVYSLLTGADFNRSSTVSPEELLAWVLANEQNVCRPYQRIILSLKESL